MYRGGARRALWPAWSPGRSTGALCSLSVPGSTAPTSAYPGAVDGTGDACQSRAGGGTSRKLLPLELDPPYCPQRRGPWDSEGTASHPRNTSSWPYFPIHSLGSFTPDPRGPLGTQSPGGTAPLPKALSPGEPLSSFSDGAEGPWSGPHGRGRRDWGPQRLVEPTPPPQQQRGVLGGQSDGPYHVSRRVPGRTGAGAQAPITASVRLQLEPTGSH